MKFAGHLRIFAFVLVGGLLSACGSNPPAETQDDERGTDVSASSSADSTVSTTGAGKGDVMVSKTDGSTMKSKSFAEQAAASSSIFYFEFDRAAIRSSEFASLKAHATYLASNPAAKARLEGHADERGTREYNIALGERRGKAVRKFLVSSGVKSSQLEVISYGEERAQNNGHNESSWSKNRRVEIKYVSGRP